MGLHATLPLWVADTWVEALSATDGPTAQLKKQLDVAEGLLEHLGIAFLATVLADRSLVALPARERIANAAARCFAKRSAFGDWVQLVDAGFRGGPALVERVAGVRELPGCPLDCPLVGAFRGVLADPPGEMTPVRFFEQLARYRNDFAHRRAEAVDAAVLVPRLFTALEWIIEQLPGITRRPLCHVARAESRDAGFVVVFRHLVGTGRTPDAQHAVRDLAQATNWRSDLLAFWDGGGSTPTPVPRWLAHYTRDTHTLAMCQGTDPDRHRVLFHTRQLNRDTKDATELYQPLWDALAGIGATRAPAQIASVSPERHSLYVEAYRRALANDGVITADEKTLLDSIAEGLGLSSADRASLEASVHPVSTERAGASPVVDGGGASPAGTVPPPFRTRSKTAIALAGIVAAAAGGYFVLTGTSASGSGAGAAPTVWRRLPAGQFTFGEGASARVIRVSAFELGESEVSNAEFSACVEAGACEPAHYDDARCLTRSADGRATTALAGDHLRAAEGPVVCVTPEQAAAYAAWAGGRLPSEAEWQYAATDAGRHRYAPWGEAAADCTVAVVDTAGDGPGCGRRGPHPALSGRAQGRFGLRHLIGNVFEIVADAYDVAGPPDDGSARVGVGSSERVIRGGGWRQMLDYANATKRGRMKTGDASDAIGFRIARDVRP